MGPLQRAFYNGYYNPTPRACWGVVTLSLGSGRKRLRPLGIVLASWGAVAVLLLIPFAAAGPAPTVNHVYASYDTGRVHVTLAAAQPSVVLSSDANAAVTALLSTVAVVELSPVGDGYYVVATAQPTPQTAFNGSRPASATAPWSLSLTAALAVRTSSGEFWNGSSSGPSPAAGPSYGVSELRVDFAPGPTTAAGASLLVTWAVSNWPLVGAGDVLGVEFNLQTADAPILEACQSATALAAHPCSGEAVGTRSGDWASSTTGVEADNASGPVAALGWTSGVTNGSAAPSVAGARADPNGGIDVVVANPVSSSPVSGTLAFALYSPTALPIVGPQVAGSGPYYLFAVAVAAGAALGGVALYRARDERIQREL